ncbi:hypothetical protein ACPA9J_11120 [Pseudomonas aeruginosa]
MRAGLAGERGALTMNFVELADAIDHVRPDGDECVVVWENVPGVLSDKGNAFGNFLAALVGRSEALEPSGPRWTNAGWCMDPPSSRMGRVLDRPIFRTGPTTQACVRCRKCSSRLRSRVGTS